MIFDSYSNVYNGIVVVFQFIFPLSRIQVVFRFKTKSMWRTNSKYNLKKKRKEKKHYFFKSKMDGRTCIVLLFCATWEAKPCIGFKTKRGGRYSWETRPILQWQESDLFLSTIDDRTIHLHLHNFWCVCEREGNSLQRQHPW